MSRYCPLCEEECAEFESFGLIPRDDALCPNCKSLERHRLSWLFVQAKLEKKFRDNQNFLHIAPERVLEKKFEALFGEKYLSADLFRKGVKVTMDITEIQYPDNSFDFIYCSHVLEHIVDDKKAMRELHRVLKADGWAILLVPITSQGVTEEDFSVTSKEERMKRYGHPDHVRNYGRDYKQRLEKCGWKVEVYYPQDLLSPEQIENMGITKAAGEVYFCTK